MEFESRYRKLNAAQKQAVDTIDGPVMVIAGPGTGKTELLSMRAANILAKTDTLPENILCLTFTESGAGAMRKRLTQIIGPNAYKVAINTFHSFGAEVINQNSKFFYHGAHFRPADELSSYELIRTIFDELEYDNPLASKMNGEYTHLRDTLATISELKKSGLTSDELLSVLDTNDSVMNTVEPVLTEIFTSRISKITASQLAPTIAQIRKSGEPIDLPGIPSLSDVLADSLEAAIAEAEALDSTKPITSWRSIWMKKNEQGRHEFKSRDRSKKLHAVSYIYFQYLSRMQQAELYDFDDMILRVVHAMEVFPELRFNLQEKYQYIMVDEFQDTNMAQMRILYNLTNNPISEDQPNILVVGDDDQAIYSFQGADVGNISSFTDIYKQTKLITLIDNYRSTDTILSHSRSIITLGQDRMENRLPELDKTLTSHKSNQETSVTLTELPTTSSERQWIVKAVAERIKTGQSPSSIAVLARRHYEIVELLPYFATAGIKVNYERRDNVLELDVIKALEHLAKLLVALFEQRHMDADSLLPELLAHPAFSIDPIEVWRLSLRAVNHQQRWMEIMASTPDFVPMHAWLVTLSQSIAQSPLEQLLDEMIGVPEEGKHRSFTSPFFDYYFSPSRLEVEPDHFLTCLEALRTIRTKLNEYHPEQTPTVQSFLEFMRLHRELGTTITNIRSGIDHIDDAINLMTAHKSKGLEFDTVYIVGATDAIWGERARKRSRLISYPENLPLAPSGDTFDERLRLFFVAMTRAKSHLNISYSSTDDTGRETPRASFLASDTWQVTKEHPLTTIESLTKTAQIMWYQPLIQPMSQSMQELLLPILRNYRLSATHLNSFLDISRGGPQAFLINNLLRFPQAIRPSAGYGLAIHAALQRAHAHLSATGNHRPIEDILHDFEQSLILQRLDPDDFRFYLQKGTDVLSTFLAAKYDDFTPDQKTELNFANQNVYLSEAHLTGSLDLVSINDDLITVTDYKTGKPSRDWTGRTDYEKIKLHRFKQQLMFYNLLVSGSRDYSHYTVAKGVLQFVEPTSRGELVALEAVFSRDDLERFSLLIQKVWQCITTLNLPNSNQYEPTFKGMLAFEADLLERDV